MNSCAKKTRGSCSNKHHTCIAQSTALTSDVVSSSPLTIPPAPAVTTTTTRVQSKWVKNLSEAPLTEAQMSLLGHGPKFTITPRSLPYGKYITVVEQACLNLEPHNAEELRAEISRA